MSASRNRPLWSDLPAAVRLLIEDLVGAAVRQARNCPGGFSPGFASRLTLVDGRGVFVKAIDGIGWPGEVAFYRDEIRANAALPLGAPAPRLLATADRDGWVVLAFEDIDGAEPAQPWTAAELDRVVAALAALDRAAAGDLPRDHPRLGGWAAVPDDPRLPGWAVDQRVRLLELEAEGLVAAHGPAVVHGDLYPHNILLTPQRVVIVDWPHARLGHPAIDLVAVLSSAAADGMDPEPVLAAAAPVDPAALTAMLAAHTGFLVSGGLSTMPPGLAAIARAKLRLGLGALGWLGRRLHIGH